MNIENTNLLLNDLSSRLNNNVKLHVNYYKMYKNTYCNGTLESIHKDKTIGVKTESDGYKYASITEIKPYLYPLSSMTAEQEIEYDATFDTIIYDDGRKDSVMTYKTFDWFNKNHFDYRGLIEKGLAIDATGLDIYDN